jgi:hypothetical protein
VYTYREILAHLFLRKTLHLPLGKLLPTLPKEIGYST